MKRLNYDDMKNNLYKRGYILLDNHYKDNRSKILVKDFDGYKYFASYNNIMKCDPSKFSYYNPYSLFNISLFMKLHNIDLRIVEGDWINSRSRFTWIDSKGYKYEGTFYDAVKGLRKVSSHNRFSIENIAMFIKLNNKTERLLSTEYVSNGTKKNK